MIRLFRVLGKRGRITIPFEIRQRIGFKYNDVLSFNQQDDGSVLVRREKICDNCKELAEGYEENFTLEDFLGSLSEEEQRNALLHLSLLWAEKLKHYIGGKFIWHRIQISKETKTTIRKGNCHISRRELISSLM